MLARTPCPDVRKYASDRVFDGARPVSKARADMLKATYARTHTMPVHRFVVVKRRILSAFSAFKFR